MVVNLTEWMNDQFINVNKNNVTLFGLTWIVSETLNSTEFNFNINNECKKWKGEKLYKLTILS